MSFKVGDILFFDKYQFTDTGEERPHFGLVLIPEEATPYQESILCCVITSAPARYALVLTKAAYSCFSKDSYACFFRKDLVPKGGLNSGTQPRGTLIKADLEKGFKILKNSLYALKDIGSSPFFRGAIIYQWKKALGKL